jgi:murein L,D-transpeptidase YcbB/YkuD
MMATVTSRRLALLAALLAAPLAGQGAQDAAPTPAGGLRLDLNIPENRLRVMDGDSVIRSYRVSVGMPGHDTPDGDFTVQRAEWNPSWRPPEREWARDNRFTPPGPSNPMGRVKLFFAPYYYLHGTPDTANIGQPASHGCVRMRNRDVIALARLLHQRAEPTVAPAEIDGILRRSSQTRWSTFRAPVPLTLRYEPIVARGDTLRFYKDVYARDRLHTEGVIQALLGAGYDVSGFDRAAARRLLARAAEAEGVLAVRIGDAFPSLRRRSDAPPGERPAR